jgi:hypothetical protein
MMMYTQAGREVEKHDCCLFILMHYPAVCLEELRKTTKYFNHDSKLLLTGVTQIAIAN